MEAVQSANASAHSERPTCQVQCSALSLYTGIFRADFMSEVVVIDWGGITRSSAWADELAPQGGRSLPAVAPRCLSYK